jgi:RNA polymerase sigma-70 factor, ECF subfamily
MDASVTFRLPHIAVSETPKQAAPGQSSSADATSDEALILQIAGGSRNALSTLFCRYCRIVRGIGYRVLRDPSEADDLLQDIFLLISRRPTSFDNSRGSARHWIIQMTYRQAISRRRYLTSRHFYSHLDLDDFAARLPAAEVAPRFENTLEGTLVKEDFRRLFQELSADQHQALLLRFVEGYTLPEIAAKMGQSRANIKNHYFRGLEKLRKHVFGGKLGAKRAL